MPEPNLTGPAQNPQTLIFTPDSFVERLDFARMFGRIRPVEVELGSGDGSFLAAWARINPDQNFLGLERLMGRLRKLDRKSRRLGLENLCAFRIEAAYCLEFMLPPVSVSALHVYFPDPWPKRKHRKNRLVNDRFVSSAAAALILEGTVYLRTDDRDYFQQMTDVFGANAEFEPAETLQALSDVTTDFERTFNERGVPTLRAAYRRVKRR